MPERRLGKEATPRGWRQVFDEFLKLKAIAARGGRATTHWSITVPAMKPWKLIWVPPNKPKTHYFEAALGRNAAEAIKTLRQLQELYTQQLRAEEMSGRQLPGRRPPEPAGPTGIPRDIQGGLVDNPVTNGQMLRAYQEKMRRTKLTRADWDRIGKHQAGILPMTMHKWLGTGLAELNPVPPMSERERDERVRAYRQMEEDRRRDAREFGYE